MERCILCQNSKLIGNLLNMDKHSTSSDTKSSVCFGWKQASLLWLCSSFYGMSWLGAEPELWSLQPIANPPLPKLNTPIASTHPVDLFIQKKLEEANLSATPRAEARHLIRRLSYDVTGLPPTYEDVRKFEKDSSPEAYRELVNRLLASPHYGEKWGRHWMDVVRYGDTKGYLTAGRDRNYAYAYTYRDWIIHALNQDLPYDQFIQRQLAADLLPELPKSELAALGFLTVGNKFLNRRHLIIDDQIDVVTRGLMGLTVACTRCHDHFFDPISQEDYYSLYGVFANIEEPKELPVLREPVDSPEYRKYKVELARKQEEIDKFLQECIDKLQTEKSLNTYLHVLYEFRAKTDEQLQVEADKRKLYKKYLLRWRNFLKHKNRKNDVLFGVWMTMLEGTFPTNSDALHAAIPKNTHPKLKAALQDTDPKTPKELIALYAKLLADTYQNPEASKFPNIPSNINFPSTFTPKSIPNYINRADRNKLNKLTAKRDQFIAASRHAPPRAMIVKDRGKMISQQIHIRGNPNTRGEQVRRKFLEVLSAKDSEPFPETSSGRLELARAITSPGNPLTARVIANRVWMHHFAKPLVDTPSDFGTQGIPPTHPELLDHLASYLIRNNWSLKALHRYILTSQTYQRTSLATTYETDPENRLLSKQNRKRLDFESQRDSILKVSNQLNVGKIGGRSEPLDKPPFSRRRAVYAKVERQNIPPIFRTFDVPNPSIHSAKRPATTTPQQALYTMNNPFVQNMAEQLTKLTNNNIQKLYHHVYSRNPTPKEITVAKQYLKSATFAQLAQILLMSNEFLFID